MWCLTLATNAVVTWTTEYHGLAVTALRARRAGHRRRGAGPHLAHPPRERPLLRHPLRRRRRRARQARLRRLPAAAHHHRRADAVERTAWGRTASYPFYPVARSGCRRRSSAPPSVLRRCRLAAARIDVTPVLHDLAVRGGVGAPSLRHRPAGHGRRCGPGPQRSPSPVAPCCACTAGFPWPRSTGRADGRTSGRPGRRGGLATSRRYREVSPDDHQVTAVRRAICRIPGNDWRASPRATSRRHAARKHPNRAGRNLTP